MFSNILIYFVVIPVLMLAGLALTRNIKQVRAVAVVGSSALLALSGVVLYQFLQLRAAGNTDPMLMTGSWVWFEPLNIHLAVGVDGISVAMLILSAIIVFAGSFASWTISPSKEFFLWLVLLSTGVFGFPQDRAAKIAVETVRTYRATNHSSIEVIFNVFQNRDHELYRDLLGQHQ